MVGTVNVDLYEMMIFSFDFAHSFHTSSPPRVIFDIVQRGSEKSCAIFDN